MKIHCKNSERKLTSDSLSTQLPHHPFMFHFEHSTTLLIESVHNKSMTTFRVTYVEPRRVNPEGKPTSTGREVAGPANYDLGPVVAVDEGVTAWLELEADGFETPHREFPLSGDSLLQNSKRHT